MSERAEMKQLRNQLLAATWRASQESDISIKETCEAFHSALDALKFRGSLPYDKFINRMAEVFEARGIDWTDCDGCGDPAEVIACYFADRITTLQAAFNEIENQRNSLVTETAELREMWLMEQRRAELAEAAILSGETNLSGTEGISEATSESAIHAACFPATSENKAKRVQVPPAHNILSGEKRTSLGAIPSGDGE